MKRIFVLISIVLSMISCKENVKIDYKNIEELAQVDSVILSKHNIPLKETHFFQITKQSYTDSTLQYLYPYIETILKVTCSSKNDSIEIYSFEYGKSYPKVNNEDIEFNKNEIWYKESYDKQIVEIEFNTKWNDFNLINTKNCKEFVYNLYKTSFLKDLEENDSNIDKLKPFLDNFVQNESILVSTYFPEIDLFFKYYNTPFYLNNRKEEIAFTANPIVREIYSGKRRINFSYKDNFLKIIEENDPLNIDIEPTIEELSKTLGGVKDTKELKTAIQDKFVSYYNIEQHFFKDIEHIRKIKVDTIEKYKLLRLNYIE